MVGGKSNFVCDTFQSEEMYRAGWRSSNAPDLYLGGAWVESWPTHRKSWLRMFRGFPRSFQATTGSFHVPSKSLFINHPTIRRYIVRVTGKSKGRPWMPVGLWDIEAPTFLDNRLTDGGEIVSIRHRPAALYPQEDPWYLFMLEAESTSRSVVNWKIQWPHRESKPRRSGL
jgi:hypothetical protein